MDVPACSRIAEQAAAASALDRAEVHRVVNAETCCRLRPASSRADSCLT